MVERGSQSHESGVPEKVVWEVGEFIICWVSSTIPAVNMNRRMRNRVARWCEDGGEWSRLYLDFIGWRNLFYYNFSY